VPRAQSGTFWFPWMDSHDSTHSIALVLLYNMRLERSFSIERFQSYTLLKMVLKIVISPTYKSITQSNLHVGDTKISSYQSRGGYRGGAWGAQAPPLWASDYYTILGSVYTSTAFQLIPFHAYFSVSILINTFYKLYLLQLHAHDS
jgi:hypothetical protein